MILSPTDVELTWSQIEASLAEDGKIAAEIWRDCGIDMEEGAASGLVCDRRDALLASSAAALNITPANIYGARQRIRWLQFCDTPGDYSIWAAIDGGAPVRLDQISTIQ